MSDAQKLKLIDKIIGEMYECSTCEDLSDGFYRAIVVCIGAVVDFEGEAQ